MNIFEKPVSYYKNVADTTGTNIQLFTFLTSAKHAAKVGELRAAVKAGATAETVLKIKKTLPACTASGLFTERTAGGLVAHSGFIAIDIDEKDNKHLTNFADVKTELCKLKEIAYCGLSCSGRGFFALVRLAHPDRHAEQFGALYDRFFNMGLVIDKACKDVTRLRFYSYDAEAFFNFDAQPFTGIGNGNGNGTVNSGKKTTLPYFTVYPKNFSNVSDAEKLADLLAWCNATHTDITGNYRAWYEIGAGLASEMGEAGGAVFHAISQHYNGYDYAKTEKQYRHCLTGKHSFTLATVFHYAKLAGWHGVTVNNGNGTVNNGNGNGTVNDADRLAQMQKDNPELIELCRRIDLVLENINITAG